MWTPRFVAASCIALLALCSCDGPPLHAFFTSQAHPVLVAHRGGGGEEPEATVPTFVHAYARDPLAVMEMDVHPTRDGQLVVIHDDTVDRTTNGQGRVAKLTLAELKALDAGYCASPGRGDGTAPEEECRGSTDSAPFPFRGLGYQIPTLEEVLAVIPLEAYVSLEVKEPGISRQVAEVLRSSGRPMSHLVVGSEFDDISVQLKDLLPDAAHFMPAGAAKCFALGSKAAIDYAQCPSYDCFASPQEGAGLRLDTRGVLEDAHDRGAFILYWTINEEDDIEAMFRLGADGIFTDYPTRARAVLERMRAAGELP